MRQLAFLAEFQQDWTTAVSQYGVAYRHLLDLLRSQEIKVCHDLQVKTQLVCVAESVAVGSFVCFRVYHHEDVFLVDASAEIGRGMETVSFAPIQLQNSGRCCSGCLDIESLFE